MSYRYSDFTMEQLREEVGRLKEKAMKAEQLGELSQVAINERKMQIVLSYMINPDSFNSGDINELNAEPGHTFKINHINGVMAWGHRIKLLDEMYEEEEAIPIALVSDNVAA